MKKKNIHIEPPTPPIEDNRSPEPIIKEDQEIKEPINYLEEYHHGLYAINENVVVLINEIRLLREDLAKKAPETRD